ncbi:unnamed protein product [Amoebophrya sp. A120]|nr:unnamed protein product [Amoebophrya sp. A120]|eukprot:GSA120T00002420001.1
MPRCLKVVALFCCVAQAIQERKVQRQLEAEQDANSSYRGSLPPPQFQGQNQPTSPAGVSPSVPPAASNYQGSLSPPQFQGQQTSANAPPSVPPAAHYGSAAPAPTGTPPTGASHGHGAAPWMPMAQNAMRSFGDMMQNFVPPRQQEQHQPPHHATQQQHQSHYATEQQHKPHYATEQQHQPHSAPSHSTAAAPAALPETAPAHYTGAAAPGFDSPSQPVKREEVSAPNDPWGVSDESTSQFHNAYVVQQPEPQQHPPVDVSSTSTAHNEPPQHHALHHAPEDLQQHLQQHGPQLQQHAHQLQQLHGPQFQQHAQQWHQQAGGHGLPVWNFPGQEQEVHQEPYYGPSEEQLPTPTERPQQGQQDVQQLQMEHAPPVQHHEFAYTHQPMQPAPQVQRVHHAHQPVQYAPQQVQQHAPAHQLVHDTPPTHQHAQEGQVQEHMPQAPPAASFGDQLGSFMRNLHSSLPPQQQAQFQPFVQELQQKQFFGPTGREGGKFLSEKAIPAMGEAVAQTAATFLGSDPLRISALDEMNIVYQSHQELFANATNLISAAEQTEGGLDRIRENVMQRVREAFDEVIEKVKSQFAGLLNTFVESDRSLTFRTELATTMFQYPSDDAFIDDILMDTTPLEVMQQANITSAEEYASARQTASNTFQDAMQSMSEGPDGGSHENVAHTAVTEKLAPEGDDVIVQKLGFKKDGNQVEAFLNDVTAAQKTFMTDFKQAGEYFGGSEMATSDYMYDAKHRILQRFQGVVQSADKETLAKIMVMPSVLHHPHVPGYTDSAYSVHNMSGSMMEAAHRMIRDEYHVVAVNFRAKYGITREGPSKGYRQDPISQQFLKYATPPQAQADSGAAPSGEEGASVGEVNKTEEVGKDDSGCCGYGTTPEDESKKTEEVVGENAAESNANDGESKAFVQVNAAATMSADFLASEKSLGGQDEQHRDEPFPFASEPVAGTEDAASFLQFKSNAYAESAYASPTNDAPIPWGFVFAILCGLMFTAGFVRVGYNYYLAQYKATLKPEVDYYVKDVGI